MRDHLILYVNGTRHRIDGGRAFQSLSDFLRYDLGLVGTKVVCAEGDCGSCTVFLGRPDPTGSRIEYCTICSCIQFLSQLDCTHIVTVEGLKYDGHLNPVQEAMVQCQGAQCGFCTPGFVVSMCAMFEQRRERTTPQDVAVACVGNLCRCTGYEPIMRAGAAVDPSSMRPLDELYPPQAMVRELNEHAGESVMVSAFGKTFCKPATVGEAVAYRAEHPSCTVLAGGTDVGVQMNKCLRDPRNILSLSALSELRTIEVQDGAVVAGALGSIADLESVTRDAIPEFARLLYWFGSPPIKNAGTIGGNVANGSPIGDSMPAMYVLNAEVELTGVNGVRRVNINNFYTGYKTNVATPGELITRVFIPIPAADEILKLYKVCRRKDLDISAFTAAIWMKRDGETISDVRIAYGGVGPNILRLKKTEDYFRGNALTPQTVREAGSIARTEITPISDVRGGADYRSQLGENVLRKLYSELSAANGNGNGH
jgi:xanthine dehydrogenase small subunit